MTLVRVSCTTHFPQIQEIEKHTPPSIRCGTVISDTTNAGKALLIMQEKPKTAFFFKCQIIKSASVSCTEILCHCRSSSHVERKAYQKNHMHNMLTSSQHNTCITSAGELCRIAVQSGHSYTKPGTARQPTILIMIMIIHNDFIYHLDQR